MNINGIQTYGLLLILLYIFLHVLTGVDCLQCCQLIGSNKRQCTQKCQQGSLQLGARQQLEHLVELHNVCPLSLTSFWGCINNTYSVMNTASRWEGRTCCWRAISESCKASCERGKSRAHVKNSCPVRSEQPFHQCLKKQEASVECCNPATLSQCRSICKAVFAQNSPMTPSQNSSLIEQCPSQIASCVHNYTKLTQPQDPAESLPCCNESADPVCREHCQRSLSTLKDESKIMDSLIQHCGILMINTQNDALWKCLIKKSSNGEDTGSEADTPRGTIEVAGMDGAKLHCCQKAATTKCRTLCSKTHGRSFSSNWKQFDAECRFSPSETDLNRCLDEVSEPCTLGCSGMDFCSNFNHRPTEMFRSCNKQSEKVAEMTVQKWINGTINLPLMDRIPVKDIRTCHPEWWRVIACALQIKPCHSQHPVTRICYHDCVTVLGSCLDRTKLPQGVTHTTLCQKLAPVEGEEEHCIRLGNYLIDSPRKSEHSEVNHPCIPNPCNSTEMCRVIRNKCDVPNTCKQYQCESGCQLGEVSPIFAPLQSYIRLPIAAELNCHRMCRCGHQGLLTKCRELGCSNKADCHLGSGRIHSHDSKFKLDCNDCLCFNGEVICTRHECFEPHKHSIKGYTGLPCNCDTQYKPVCGQNGHTYWNPCLARCSRINDRQFKSGECIAQEPCRDNNCNRNEVCVPRYQKCLHHNNCRQYVCININKECDSKSIDAVCDTEGIEYVNPCVMLQSGGQLAYWGHCKDGCDYRSGKVCGMDRETYKSECHAWAASVMVDYYGTCHVTPALVGKEEDAEYVCEGLICPDISTKEFCTPIKPIGVCCYVCASEIRVLYSKNLIKTMMDPDLGLIYTVHDIAKSLARHLSTVQCDVFAYISVEQDLTLLVAATTKFPTPVQVDACKMEAEKLKELIDSRASSIQILAETSPLLVATIRQPQTRPFALQSAYGSSPKPCTLSFHLLFVCLLFTTFKWSLEFYLLRCVRDTVFYVKIS